MNDRIWVRTLCALLGDRRMGMVVNMTHASSSTAEAVDLVLKAIVRRPELDNGTGGFHVSRPHSGAEIHFEGSALLDAALFIRRNASAHLQSLSVDDLQQMLVKFMGDEMDLFRFDWWSLPDNASLADHVTAEERAELVSAMGRSPIFAPPQILFLYPVTIANVAAPFRSDHFFLIPPRELPPELARWYDADEVMPEKHPPTPMHVGMALTDVSCWLGVRAPVGETALRMRNAILGALALLPHPMERYTFSMRAVPPGYMSFGSTATYHSGAAATPALSEKLVLGPADRGWMETLARLLTSDNGGDVKALLALQYFYRSWVRDAATRVGPLCGALDALFGDQNAATQAMVDAVGSHLGSSFDAARARRLAKLRAGVIHGGAPNIYEASVYHRYYVDYRQDPIRDLEIATASCLRTTIFGDGMVERSHTHADLIRQTTGRIV
ncbi:hypothetical protein [uncultured Sphingomonas sp.]|uniref:hypothetical protein n=1 Tax=uncultured Sphingomonas sp. TaxID=158754 RepID=UPI0025CC6980|nr:hypothetical protein [uncultured Sphingomonas sp.]